MNKNKITQSKLIKEFFTNHPNRAIPHAESVDWLTREFKKRTGEVFRDPDRGIRSLAQQNFLIKISKGLYKYDPSMKTQRDLEDFTFKQKTLIKKRDKYRCVICGKGEKEGVELHVDHIKPKELGGQATIENGQTLCAPHNFQKKTLKQTETGKKMFIRLYQLAKQEKNKKTMEFCEAVLKTYEKHDVNGHIEWEK